MAVFKIISGSNADEFIQYLNRVEHGFVYMIETMKDVARVIKENTIPLTPVDTTRLQKSFKWTVVTDNSRMKVLQIQMSALNPETGYDYAMTQHLGYRRTKSGRIVQYSHNTEPDLGDSWLKVLDAHGYYPAEAGMLNVPTFYGIGSKYLYRGIRESEEGAFQLIEEDYLSLFQRGFIY